MHARGRDDDVVAIAPTLSPISHLRGSLDSPGDVKSIGRLRELTDQAVAG